MKRLNHRKCADSECLTRNSGPDSRRVVRRGSYFRRSDGQRIPRFLCRACGRSFSSGTGLACYRQKKRKVNHRLMLLLNSGVSQRRAALVLGVTRRTVVRKFRFLAAQARFEHERWLQSLEKSPLSYAQFDDLETSEHTKCKPLSVALAVEPRTRKVLGFQVSQMPAKGLLSRVAVRKYGPRADLRSQGWNALFRSSSPSSLQRLFGSRMRTRTIRGILKGIIHWQLTEPLLVVAAALQGKGN